MGSVFTKENIGDMLDRAIEQGDIIAYYQPKYDVITGKVTGSEALARWKNSDGGLYPPDSFIPLLESNGLVTRLDWYMLEVVCRFIRKQIDMKVHKVPVSVNFSRLHTSEDNFIEHICGIVDKYNIPHKYIEAEITESALARDGNIISFIDEIRKCGFSVAIDDFGSGLSSLNFVKDVPANVLKIDKSLLSGNCENEKERIVLESIFNFAKRLKLITVAEGVETKEQLGFLRTCGCETIQGFFFSKPLPESEYSALCSNSPEETDTEDILLTQPAASATQLLLDAIFMCYPLVIMSNLSKNSFYMMVYENFSTCSCPSTGVYTELIVHGAATMHPDDAALFSDTFKIDDQIAAYNRGERTRSVITRQLGDDGIYRRVESTNYYVKNPASDDILAITLSKALE
ncbi:MAG: EAL domain-containing protein [Oscillospiraceae bacterium]|nr:EAL domain-containing protein [Oscillospiraceae bacterium]